MALVARLNDRNNMVRMKLTNIIFVLLVFFPFYVKGKEIVKLVKDKKTNILFYDLNKNGKMDIYENPTLDIESRVEDILSQMTLEEKIGQMLTSLGWHMYERVGDDVRLTKRLTEELDKYHIGSLWGFMRADPWTQRTLKTGLNPTLAPKAVNKLQRYVIEKTRLGIPLFLAEECPHGHMAIGTTVFPTSIGQSSTWNLKLIEQMGRAIAKEARAQGAHIGYGPVLDLARDPRWSRVEETYGEDPFLIGKMGEALVRGFQGDDFNPGESLLSTLKHFASYGWTEGGHNGASAHVGMREMEEAILPPFREAINAGALSVMSSYNEIDGIPSTANYHLLTKVLRNRWGFQGFTISDLRSIGRLREHGVAASDYEAAVKAVNAGLDNDLGMNVYGDQLGEAVKKGDVLPLIKSEINEVERKPPKPHTEKTLLKVMETCGKKYEEKEEEQMMMAILSGFSIGTPATRAETIKKLKDAGYIKAKGKSLSCTDLGKILVETFPARELFDLEYTGRLEKTLSDIERKKFTKDDFLAMIEQFVIESVDKIKNDKVFGGPVTLEPLHTEPAGICPECGAPVVETARAFGCSGWKKGCKFAIWKDDRFITSLGKKVSYEMVKILLEHGKVGFRGCVSKRGNKFSAYFYYEKDEKTGRYNWRLEFIDTNPPQA